MADWTSLDPNSLLPGQPITSAIGQALEENPRAIAEGAAGAPKVQGAALDNVYLGAIRRLNSTSSIGFSDLDGLNGVALIGEAGGWPIPSDGTQARFSSNNGASYTSWQNFGAASIPEVVTCGVHIDFVSGDWESHHGVTVSVANGTFTMPPNVNAFQIRLGVAEPDRGFVFSVFAIGGTA